MSVSSYVGHNSNKLHVIPKPTPPRARWQRLPLRYRDHPLYALMADSTVLDVAMESVQDGRLLPIPRRALPYAFAAARVFASLI